MGQLAPGQYPTAAGAARIREGRRGIAFGVLVVGIFAVVATQFFSRAAAAVVALYQAALLAALLVPWSLIRRRALWWCGLTVPTASFLYIAFVVPGLAALATVVTPNAFRFTVGCTCLTTSVAALRYFRRYDAAWERSRSENEREVLDLEAGTYDVQRGFVPLVIGGTASPIWIDRVALPLASGVGAVAAAGGAVLVGDVDYRVWVVGILSPVLAVLLVQLPVQAIVHLRRLRGYERRLGRPILNR